MLPLIQGVHEYLDMPEARKAVTDTIELIREMAEWLDEYMEKCFTGVSSDNCNKYMLTRMPAVHAFAFSSDQRTKADDFQRKFKVLRDRFGSGVSVENLRRIVLAGQSPQLNLTS